VEVPPTAIVHRERWRPAGCSVRTPKGRCEDA
jgi:hypothetical protein